MATGAGGFLGPPITAVLFLWKEYMTVYLGIAVGYLIIAPFIYRQLYQARDQYAKLKKD